MKKITFAIPAEVAAIPVNPSSAATTATPRKMNTQVNIQNSLVGF